LFAPIEKHSFVASREHALLLAYRQLCMEIVARRSALDTIPLLKKMDTGGTEPGQRDVQ
jgi:hypothetical protein